MIPQTDRMMLHGPGIGGIAVTFHEYVEKPQFFFGELVVKDRQMLDDLLACQHAGYFVPPDWPKDAHKQPGFVGIAADYWEEAGESDKAALLRRAGHWMYEHK